MLYYLRLPHDDPALAALSLPSGHGWTEALVDRDPDHLGVYRRPDGWVLDGAGDLPLAALFFGALFHLRRLLSREGALRGDAWRAGLLLGGAALMKNEGLALAGVLGLAALPCLLLGPRPRRAAAAGLLRAFGLAGALVLPWLWVRRSIPSIDEDYPSLLRPAAVAERWAENAPAVAWEFLKTFASPLSWNLLWPLFAVALLALCPRPRRLLAPGVLLPVLVVAGGLALYFLILVVTPWDLGKLFRTGIPDRLLLHVAPAAALACGAMIWSRGGAE